MITAFLSADNNNQITTWIFVGLLVLLIVALLVVPMFTNKKRAKQTNELHNSLRPGDVVKTVGGIIGTIVEIRQVSPTEKEMLIETGEGDNKMTMLLDIQALYQVMSRAAQPAAPVAEEKPVENTKADPVADKDKTPETAATSESEQAAVDTKVVADETVAPTESSANTTVAENTVETSDATAAKAEDEQKKPAKTSAPKSATPAKKKPVNSANKSTKK